MSNKYKVVFDGFETLEQAKAFADWYCGSGEQDSGDSLDVNTEDINGAYVDCSKVAENKGYKVDENNNLIVPLKLYHKE